MTEDISHRELRQCRECHIEKKRMKEWDRMTCSVRQEQTVTEWTTGPRNKEEWNRKNGILKENEVFRRLCQMPKKLQIKNHTKYVHYYLAPEIESFVGPCEIARADSERQKLCYVYWVCGKKSPTCTEYAVKIIQSLYCTDKVQQDGKFSKLFHAYWVCGKKYSTSTQYAVKNLLLLLSMR